VRLLLEAYRDADLARAAAAIIRGWANEEPRALWERLRAEGPPRGVDAGEVARWAWVQGHGDSSKPPRLASPYQNPQGNADGSWKAPPPDWLARRAEVLPALPATITPDARTVDPREVARWAWLVNRTMPQALARGATDGDFNGGKVATAAGLAAQVERNTLPATIAPDAREVHPPALPPGTVCYMDPPYFGTTGYASDLPRADVVALARRWATAGAMVAISEAEPIADLVADGWHAVRVDGERRGQKRTFSKQQAEWVTMNRPPAWTPPEQRGLFA